MQSLSIHRRSDSTLDAVSPPGCFPKEILSCKSDSLLQRKESCSSSTIEYLYGQISLSPDRPRSRFGPTWKEALAYRDNWIMRSILGVIRMDSCYKHLHLASTNNHVDDKEGDVSYENQTVINIRPARWISIIGFESGFTFDFTRSSIYGWKSVINSFHAVPDNSLIFRLCEDGNLSAVRLLFETGEASVRDTDSLGFQPLYISARVRYKDLRLTLYQVCSPIPPRRIM